MKFKVQADALNEALSTVAVVAPSVDAQDNAGFLFVVQGETCSVYSENAGEKKKSRADFPITDVEGEGAFVLPLKKLKGLKSLQGWIEFEPIQDEGAHTLNYTSEDGSVIKTPTLDPRALQGLDKDFASAEDGPSFPAALFKEALNTTRGFLLDPEDKTKAEYYKSLQLFDASKKEWEKGDGSFFAANGIRGCYFQCNTLKGKHINILGSRVPLVLTFLSKSKGNVQLKKSKTCTYLVNEKNQVLGWADQAAMHSKFNFYKLKNDQHIFRIPRDVFLRALAVVRDHTDPKKNRLHLAYNHEDQRIKLFSSDGASEVASMPIPVIPLTQGEDDNTVGGAQSKTTSIEFDVNMDALKDLLSVKGGDVELRASLVDKDKNRFVIRTTEAFTLDEGGKVIISKDDSEGEAYSCQVTRFTMGMV